LGGKSHHVNFMKIESHTLSQGFPAQAAAGTRPAMSRPTRRKKSLLTG
jgi:hypothetical protein